MDDKTRKQIEKLRDRYQEKAEEHWLNYQDGATRRSLNAHYRNQNIADALDVFLNSKNTREMYQQLAADVMDISIGNYHEMERQVLKIKNLISDGAYLSIGR